MSERLRGCVNRNSQQAGAWHAARVQEVEVEVYTPFAHGEMTRAWRGRADESEIRGVAAQG